MVRCEKCDMMMIMDYSRELSPLPFFFPRRFHTGRRFLVGRISHPLISQSYIVYRQRLPNFLLICLEATIIPLSWTWLTIHRKKKLLLFLIMIMYLKHLIICVIRSKVISYSVVRSKDSRLLNGKMLSYFLLNGIFL